MDLKPVQESARKLFGADIEIMLASCKAWDNDDNCIVVRGERHAEAATGFVRVVRGAKLSSHKTAAFMDSPAESFSTVEWA